MEPDRPVELGINAASGAEIVGFRHPVVAFLVVAGLFSFLWGKPLDGLIVMGIALVATRAGPGRRTERAAPAHWPLVATVAIAYGVTVGMWARFSWPTTIAVFLAGLPFLVLANRWPPRTPPPQRPPGQVSNRPWAVVWLAVCAWEVIAFAQQPNRVDTSWEHPTLSALADIVLAGHAGRAVFLAAWLATGWAVARR